MLRLSRKITTELLAAAVFFGAALVVEALGLPAASNAPIPIARSLIYTGLVFFSLTFAFVATRQIMLYLDIEDALNTVAKKRKEHRE